jgi:hypothetical protein
MILSQGLVMIGLWIVNSSILLVWISGWMVPNEVDLPLKRQAATLLALLQDENDPSRFQVQARRLQEVAETYAPYRSEQGQYRSVFQILDGQGSLLFRSDAAPQKVMTLAGPGRHNITLDGAIWRVVVEEVPRRQKDTQKSVQLGPDSAGMLDDEEPDENGGCGGVLHIDHVQSSPDPKSKRRQCGSHQGNAGNGFGDDPQSLARIRIAAQHEAGQHDEDQQRKGQGQPKPNATTNALFGRRPQMIPDVQHCQDQAGLACPVV